MKFTALILSVIFYSCVPELPTEPEFSLDLKSIGLSTKTLSEAAKENMEGVYSVLKGNELFGDEVVGRWVNNSWCILANHDVVYSENIGGASGDSILLAGYIRIVRAGSGTRMDLHITPHEGGSDLVLDKVPAKIILRGNTSSGIEIILQRTRPLFKPQKNFYILAHRGGGRNSERLGISENSIEMIKHSQILGANGVEIDAKRTRDNQVIVFHDDTFSPRTIRGTYLLGRVENFDLAQIQAFGRLKYGESIPTLKDALIQIVDSTSLNLIWIDVKDPAIVDNVISLQLEAINRADAINRNVLILFGIPDSKILKSYQSSTLNGLTPILIEFDPQESLSNSACKVWAPRWTNGINKNDFNMIHNHKDKLVFLWTLDVKEFIADYVYDDNGVDGILSNYPSLVAGMYYARN